MVESALERKDLGFLAIPACGYETFLWNSGLSVLTRLKVHWRLLGQTLMKATGHIKLPSVLSL